MARRMHFLYLSIYCEQPPGVDFVKESLAEIHLRAIVWFEVLVSVAPEKSIAVACRSIKKETNSIFLS